MKHKNVIFGILVVIGIAAALGFYLSFGNRSGALQLHGIVEIQEVRLGSKIGGRVKEVRVSEGQTVKKDEVLVVFEAPELQAQRKELLADLGKAEADLEKVEKGLPRDIEMAKAAADAAKERWQKAEKGWRPEEIKMVKDDLNVALADKEYAELEFGRVAKLQPKGSAATGELDLAKANLKRADAKFAAAKTKWDMVNAGGMEEDKKAAKKDWLQADTSYKKLVETEYAIRMQAQKNVDLLRAKLEKNEVDLKETEVRAQEKSIVEVISVRPGDVVAPNAPIVRVLREGDMWVKVFVSEIDIGKIRLEQKVDVYIDSYPGQKFVGTVIQVGTIAEYTPRNVQSKEERRYQVFPVKIRVTDPQGVFKAGMAAEVSVPPAPVQ
jgi:multidrug resistance efflux pump